MADTKTFTVTLTDGTTHKVRPMYIDKVAAERTCDTNGWPLDRHPLRFMSVLAYNILKRRGDVTVSYDEFMADLEDVEADDTEDDEDPTQADTSA